MSACADCRHFRRHTALVQGPFASDEYVEVARPGGDCRRYPPQRSGVFGSAFPYVRSQDVCGEFSVSPNPLTPTP